MRQFPLLFLVLSGALLVDGCHTPSSKRIDYKPHYAQEHPEADSYEGLGITPELEKEILALDPERVSGEDIAEVLSRAPAPRIINIHGGLKEVYKSMVSFSHFLEGMGYPESRLMNPLDGTYSFSGYMSSEKIAGAAAWYYEREGLRPMMIGHSLGGFQTVGVLHQLSGDFSEKISVWSPLTEQEEERYEIVDPLTGKSRPVVGLRLSYASAVAAGGMARAMPATWGMTGKLRLIPDSVDEFTGYYIGMDIAGGDFLGFGGMNHYKATGTALVRNVQLPTSYPHTSVPESDHLLESLEVVDWINNYTPTNQPTLDVEFDSDTSNIMWATDVWYGIKKHWVLELQRVILAQRVQKHDN